MKYRLTLATALVIAVLSLAPIPDTPPLGEVPFIDKWVHFVMYGALTCAMYIYHRLARQKPSPGFASLALALPSLYGGIMELLQAHCTTYRSGEWLDFYADAFGALLASIISLTIWKLAKISAHD